jgi:hypothetical protein
MPTIFDTTPKKSKPTAQTPAAPPVQTPIEPENSQQQAPKPTLSHAEESVEKLMHSKTQSMGLFAAYAQHPTGVKFTSQEPDEVILLFLRRHFITNIPWILATFLLLLLPVVFLAILTLLPSLNLPVGLTIVLIAFYYLISTSYAFGKVISWFYNIGIVTQKRIVDLDSHNILAHNSATATFNEIVDVKFHQHGFFQSTFDYGNIVLQTEALHTNFEFDAAPKPTAVADIISDLRVAQKGHHGNS